MHSTKKRNNRFLYKKCLLLKKNIKNSDKIFKFKKKKWQKFQHFLRKLKKKKFYDPAILPLFNFKNFFNKKFKYNLHNKQRIRFFYGEMKKYHLKKFVKLAIKKSKISKKRATILFIQYLESRLDVTLYKTHFSYSLENARQYISHKKVYVNGGTVQNNSYQLKKGDLITFDISAYKYLNTNITSSKMWPIPPNHYYINYKTFQILIAEDIKYNNNSMYYPFWIDFDSFLHFYKK